MILSKR